jgi:hypothetical protein
MCYSVHYNSVQLTIGVAALFVGGVHFGIGIRDLVSSRLRSLRGWRHLLLGVLFTASGRYMCLESIRLT